MTEISLNLVIDFSDDEMAT